MKEEQGQRSDVGVLQIFPMRDSSKKIDKTGIAAIFKIRIKKGSEPIFLNYHKLKDRYPQILLDYFEKKAVLKGIDERQEQDTGKLKKIEASPKQVAKSKRKQEQTGLRDKAEEDKNVVQKTQHSGYSKFSVSQNQSLKKHSKVCKSIQRVAKKQPKEQTPNYEQDSLIMFSNEEGNIIRSNAQILPAPTSKKILDYDCMVQQLGFVNLSSPAVIVNTRQKAENTAYTFRLLQRTTFIGEIEPEPFSSEPFRQSEESQFLLDDRGKQKRRRQKQQKQQQRQFRNRGKKIKKKKKAA